MLTEAVSFPAAFLAGLLSFFSPCVLPLIPAYFTFITGVLKYVNVVAGIMLILVGLVLVTNKLYLFSS